MIAPNFRTVCTHPARVISFEVSVILNSPQVWVLYIFGLSFLLRRKDSEAGGTGKFRSVIRKVVIRDESLTTYVPKKTKGENIFSKIFHIRRQNEANVFFRRYKKDEFSIKIILSPKSKRQEIVIKEAGDNTAEIKGYRRTNIKKVAL